MKHLPFTLAAIGTALVSHAATPAESLISKARAALGEEAALNAVQSLRVEMSAANGEGKSLGALISEYKAPMKQRELDYTADKFEVVTAIDGREGHRVLHRMDNNARQLQILPAEEVNARRDFVTANLALLAAPSAERGEVAVAADETVDGTPCAVLAYKYKSGITLRRYIDKKTFRLVASRIDQAAKTGELMVNQGEQRVGGILYPKSIVIKDAAGKTLRTLTVAKVEVNPTLDDAGFATPLL